MKPISMGRITTAVLFLTSLVAAQSSALPTTPKVTRPADLYRYSIQREESYKGMNCEDASWPEAMSTPNPMLESVKDPIVVSFIIGEDGHVYSPLILSSDVPKNDREVLRVIRTWRFRPATCNGVPWNTEGSVGFGTF